MYRCSLCVIRHKIIGVTKNTFAVSTSTWPRAVTVGWGPWWCFLLCCGARHVRNQVRLQFIHVARTSLSEHWFCAQHGCSGGVPSTVHLDSVHSTSIFAQMWQHQCLFLVCRTARSSTGVRGTGRSAFDHAPHPIGSSLVDRRRAVPATSY